jgi:hypothetical protein
MTRIVVAHPERRAQRALQRMVGATACTVDVVCDAAALAEAVDADTIAIVDAELACAAPALRERAARAWIAVPGEGLAPSEPATVDALLAAGWQHVVTHAIPILAEELLATVQKLLRADVFGLDKYMVWGATVKRYALTNTGDRDDIVAALAREVVTMGLPDRVASLVSVVADELVANALYIAPVDGGGARFRADEPRDRRRALADRDCVTVRLATDARYLAIEVRDRWGSLDPDAIAPRLATKSANAPAEAGMGLPLVYACCNQLVIGCAPRTATETIALVDVRYKPTELGRSASFHVFTGELV